MKCERCGHVSPPSAQWCWRCLVDFHRFAPPVVHEMTPEEYAAQRQRVQERASLDP